MTIRSNNRDDEAADMVVLPSIWSVLMKVQLALLVPTLMAGGGWATWITTGWFQHDTRLALLERSVDKGHASQSTSVNVGAAAAKMAADAKSRREYLNTAEVAAMESVSERTIIEWIARGFITPPPVKAGKEWQFSAEYRISPQAADELRTAATAP